MEVQIGVGQACDNLRLIERGAESILGPGPMLAVGKDRGRPLWDGGQDFFQIIIQRDDRLAPVITLAGGDDDGIVADVRP